MKPLIGEVRAAFKDPLYLGNLEKAGNACADYIKRTSGDEAYATFAQRVS
jgi:hypothetical protein